MKKMADGLEDSYLECFYMMLEQIFLKMQSLKYKRSLCHSLKQQRAINHLKLQVRILPYNHLQSRETRLVQKFEANLPYNDWGKTKKSL